MRTLKISLIVLFTIGAINGILKYINSPSTQQRAVVRSDSEAQTTAPAQPGPQNVPAADFCKLGAVPVDAVTFGNFNTSGRGPNDLFKIISALNYDYHEALLTSRTSRAYEERSAAVAKKYDEIIAKMNSGKMLAYGCSYARQVYLMENPRRMSFNITYGFISAPRPEDLNRTYDEDRIGVRGTLSNFRCYPEVWNSRNEIDPRLSTWGRTFRAPQEIRDDADILRSMGNSIKISCEADIVAPTVKVWQ